MPTCPEPLAYDCSFGVGLMLIMVMVIVMAMAIAMVMLIVLVMVIIVTEAYRQIGWHCFTPELVKRIL
jgi:hypothetical protein